MTNLIKYTFPYGRGGKIRVNFSVMDNKAKPTVSYDGTGLPRDFDINSPKTLGMRLVKTLTAQLKGGSEVKNRYGRSFEIEFSYS